MRAADHPKFGEYFPPERPSEIPWELQDFRVSRFAWVPFLKDPTQPEISVLTIDHYANEEWTTKMRESVAKQEGLRTWELVSVENRDNAMSIGAAWNAAARNARADWVFFLSEDDWIHTRCLAALLDKGRAEDLDVVGCDSIICDRNGKRRSRGWGSLGLVRRAYFMETGGFSSRDLMEDYDWKLQAQENGARIGHVDTPYYFYRMHRGQASSVLKEVGGVYEDLERFGGVV